MKAEFVEPEPIETDVMITLKTSEARSLMEVTGKLYPNLVLNELMLDKSYHKKVWEIHDMLCNLLEKCDC
jgi:hypothetical protein